MSLSPSCLVALVLLAVVPVELGAVEPASSSLRGATTPAQFASTPEALVTALYHLPAKESPFFQTKNRAAINRFFTRPLADLIWQDALISHGEIGALEADPLYDSQDPEPTGFAIHPAQTEGAKSSVTVTFTDHGKKRTFVYQLTQSVSEGWKISDIRWTPQRTLLKTLQAAAPAKR